MPTMCFKNGRIGRIGFTVRPVQLIIKYGGWSLGRLVALILHPLVFMPGTVGSLPFPIIYLKSDRSDLSDQELKNQRLIHGRFQGFDQSKATRAADRAFRPVKIPSRVKEVHI